MSVRMPMERKVAGVALKFRISVAANFTEDLASYAMLGRFRSCNKL
jgi:hypothetical protein